VAWSLGVTAAILVATMVLSLFIPARTEPTRPGTSSLAGAPSARLVTSPRKTEEGEGG
jgi:hypothetical protein